METRNSTPTPTLQNGKSISQGFQKNITNPYTTYMRNFCNLFGLEQLYFSFTLASEAWPKTNGQPGKGWPGQAFWVFARLTRKMRPGKAGKHGHSQAFLTTLATKAWPSWPCYFQG